MGEANHCRGVRAATCDGAVVASSELLSDGRGKDPEQVVAARGRAHKENQPRVLEIRKARQLI